jgi:hypothetical protein
MVRETAGLKGKRLLLLLNQARSNIASKGSTAAADKPKDLVPAQKPSGTQSTLPEDERLVVELLKEIKRVSESHRAQMLVLDIPNYGTAKTVAEAFPKDPEGRDFGLKVVRPIELFRKVPDDQLLFRKLGHAHLTPLGCRLVSELLTEEILKNHLLDTRSGPGA